MLNWLRRFVRRRTAGSRPAATYRELRSFALNVDPAALKISNDAHWRRAWLAALETSDTMGAQSTLIAVADGSVSLYLSSGGAVIGAGEHVAIRDAAGRFLDEASAALRDLRPADELPPPNPGAVCLHVRTADGALTAEAPEALLRRGRHPLSPAWFAAQDVLAEIRGLDEPA